MLPIEVDARRAAHADRRHPDRSAPELDPAPLLAAVGLTADDHVGPPPRRGRLRAGVPVPVGAAGRGGPRPVTRRRRRGTGSTTSACSPGTPSRATAHARVFVPGLGRARGPGDRLGRARPRGLAGRAAACCPATGESTYAVRQGVEMHRPSTLECTVTAADGRGGRRDGRRSRGAGRPRRDRRPAVRRLSGGADAGGCGCDGRGRPRGHPTGRRGDEEGRRGLGQRCRWAGARRSGAPRWRARSWWSAGRASRPRRVWPTRPRPRSPCAATTAVGSSPGRPG